MKKGYWISLYSKVQNEENLKKYAETVTPIIKSFGGVPLVRGGNHETFEGDDFVRTVVWNFQVMKKPYNAIIVKNIWLDGILQKTQL